MPGAGAEGGKGTARDTGGGVQCGVLLCLGRPFAGGISLTCCSNTWSPWQHPLPPLPGSLLGGCSTARTSGPAGVMLLSLNQDRDWWQEVWQWPQAGHPALSGCSGPHCAAQCPRLLRGPRFMKWSRRPRAGVCRGSHSQWVLDGGEGSPEGPGPSWSLSPSESKHPGLPT